MSFIKLDVIKKYIFKYRNFHNMVWVIVVFCYESRNPIKYGNIELWKWILTKRRNSGRSWYVLFFIKEIGIKGHNVNVCWICIIYQSSWGRFLFDVMMFISVWCLWCEKVLFRHQRTGYFWTKLDQVSNTSSFLIDVSTFHWLPFCKAHRTLHKVTKYHKDDKRDWFCTELVSFQTNEFSFCKPHFECSVVRISGWFLHVYCYIRYIANDCIGLCH